MAGACLLSSDAAMGQLCYCTAFELVVLCQTQEKEYLFCSAIARSPWSYVLCPNDYCEYCAAARFPRSTV